MSQFQLSRAHMMLSDPDRHGDVVFQEEKNTFQDYSIPQVWAITLVSE